jgi:hypothetical protein
MESMILIVFVILLLPISILPLFNRWLPEWFCKKLGWHLAPKVQKFDGASFGGNCPRCNKAVLKDSQGNWF